MEKEPWTLDVIGADPTGLPWIPVRARERPECVAAGRTIAERARTRTRRLRRGTLLRLRRVEPTAAQPGRDRRPGGGPAARQTAPPVVGGPAIAPRLLRHTRTRARSRVPRRADALELASLAPSRLDDSCACDVADVTAVGAPRGPISGVQNA